MSEGYVLGFGTCWSCGVGFTFNPETVPSLPIDPATDRPPDLGGDEANAIARPICSTCIDFANAWRASEGKPTIFVPRGAYGPET